LARIHVCDLPEKYERLKGDFAGSSSSFFAQLFIYIKNMVLGMPNITPMLDGHAVSRSSDFIAYSVEAEFLEKVVKIRSMYVPDFSRLCQVISR